MKVHEAVFVSLGQILAAALAPHGARFALIVVAPEGMRMMTDMRDEVAEKVLAAYVERLKSGSAGYYFAVDTDQKRERN